MFILGKKGGKKKKNFDDVPFEDMTEKEQDAAIEELLSDDSINKRIVNPIRPETGGEDKPKRKPSKDENRDTIAQKDEL